MKLFTTKQTGDIGEEYTERYLRKNGYKILERNYRRKCGEIDIIAQKGEYIIFNRAALTSAMPGTARAVRCTAVYTP